MTIPAGGRSHPIRSAKRVLRARLQDLVRSAYARGILPKSRLTLPDFLGLGGPQSGSTWLHENLLHHPELFLPAQKEVHYFDRGLEKSLSSYAELFVEGRGKVKGEITPDYCILSIDRIRLVHRLLPESRLIYIMRNPIDRVWSLTRRRFGKYHGRDIDTVPESELVEFIRTQPPKPGVYGTPKQRSDHLRNIENWLSVFPKEQLLVRTYDEIAARPRELLTSIFAHLGVSTDLDWATIPFESRFNKSPTRDIPAASREILEEIYAGPIEELYARFGEMVAPWRLVN